MTSPVLLAPPIQVDSLDRFVWQFQQSDTSAYGPTIEAANRSDAWIPSEVGGGDPSDPINRNRVERESRDSSQIMFDPYRSPDVHASLLSFAGTALEIYLAETPAANDFPSFSVQEKYTLLKYEPGQAYHRIHADTSPRSQRSVTRHLTFVLFLNTVKQGGELEFPHQDIRVSPVEGRAVIFPSTWVYAHRTLPARGDRYVFQLWWSFDDGLLYD
tara:strand:- start:1163 stop:1807 length:645 start_codon:yes stop_codon:yes gene_type:complete